MHRFCLFVLALLLPPMAIRCSGDVTRVTFNNGESVPILGLGTFRSQSNEVIQAVKDAIEIGYRHIDTAYVYRNEKEIGQALAQIFAKGDVKREDVFVTSKLWDGFHKPNKVENALRITLQDLGLQYIDLYLMHSPMGTNEDGSFSDDDYVDTWLAMEKLYQKGLAKSIGVSNFNKGQIERLLKRASVVPVTNQVECHPYLNQQKLIDFCASKNISVTAYSPLGQAGARFNKPNLAALMENPKILEISTRLKKTPAQILIRYQIQRGVIVIPKSVTRHRIEENYQVFDFQLSPNDMKTINGLNANARAASFSWVSKHKYFPFKDEY